MNNQSSANKQHDDAGCAEQLYGEYRHTRPELQRSDATAVVDDDSLSDQVYATFQNTRTCDREAIIDSIVLSVRQAQESEKELTRKKQSMVNGDADTESVARIVKSLLGAPSRLLDRLMTPSTKLPGVVRFGVPVVIAGVLAFLLVPAFFTQSAFDEGIPASLSRQASVVVPFIEEDHTQAFGFSGASAQEKSAFNLGRLSATLSIAASAGQPSTLAAVGEQLVAVAEEQKLDALAGAATDYLVDVTPASIRSDEFNQRIADLQMRLAGIPGASGTSQWFQQGQTVEAIVLAGELARQTQDTKPLADALIVWRGFDLAELGDVKTRLPIGLFEELQNVNPDEALSLAVVRQILSTARNIKVLMH